MSKESKCISLDTDLIEWVESERVKRKLDNWSQALRTVLREAKDKKR